MKRVPYDVMRNMYLLMIREGELSLEQLYDKAYFITGHRRDLIIRGYLRGIKGLLVSNNKLTLDVSQCPSWVQYTEFIKRNGPVTTVEIMEKFGHNQSKVHNEMIRYRDLFDKGKDGKNNTYMLKELNNCV